MKRKKLFKMLGKVLSMEGHKQRKHQEELEVLLEKLDKKKAELEQKMLLETNKRKLVRLGKELEIIKAQGVKGLLALKELTLG